MFQVTIQGNTDILERAKRVLSQQQVEDACRMALNEAANKGRTLVRRSIQEVYNIKASRINDSDRKKGITVKGAQRGSLTAYINAGHSPVGFANFTGVKMEGKQTGQEFSTVSLLKSKKQKTVKGKKVFGGGGISVEIFKGQRRVIPSAFVIGPQKHFNSSRSIAVPGKAIFARGKAGKPGFEFGKDRMPIAGLGSVSIATAAHNTKAVEKYSNPLNQFASQRFIHHLERLIVKVEGG